MQQPCLCQCHQQQAQIHKHLPVAKCPPKGAGRIRWRGWTPFMTLAVPEGFLGTSAECANLAEVQTHQKSGWDGEEHHTQCWWDEVITHSYAGGYAKHQQQPVWQHTHTHKRQSWWYTSMSFCQTPCQWDCKEICASTRKRLDLLSGVCLWCVNQFK